MILSILSSRQTALPGSLAYFSDYFLSVSQKSFSSIWCSLFQAFCSHPSLFADSFCFFLNTPSSRNHIIWRSPKFPVFQPSLFSWLSTQASPLYSRSNVSYVCSFLLNGCQNMQLLPSEYCEDDPPYLAEEGGKCLSFQTPNSS